MVRRMDIIRINCGLLFEEFLNDLLIDAGLPIEHRKKHGKLVPDFTLGTTLLDAKLTAEVAENEESRIKYEPICDKLLLIYLIGYKRDYKVSDKTRIVRYDFLYDLIKGVNREKRIKYHEERFSLLYQIADMAKQEREIILGGKSNDE